MNWDTSSEVEASKASPGWERFEVALMGLATVRDSSFLGLPAANVEHRRRGLDRDESPVWESLGEIDQLRARPRADAADSRIAPQFR